MTIKIMNYLTIILNIVETTKYFIIFESIVMVE